MKFRELRRKFIEKYGNSLGLDDMQRLAKKANYKGKFGFGDDLTWRGWLKYWEGMLVE